MIFLLFCFGTASVVFAEMLVSSQFKADNYKLDTLIIFTMASGKILTVNLNCTCCLFKHQIGPSDYSFVDKCYAHKTNTHPYVLFSRVCQP